MESTSGEGNVKNKMSSSPSKWQHGEIRTAQKGIHVPPCLTHQTAQVIKSLHKSNAMTEISTTQSSNPALLIDLTSPREITGSCWNRECLLLPAPEIFLSDPCHFSNNCDFFFFWCLKHFHLTCGTSTRKAFLGNRIFFPKSHMCSDTSPLTVLDASQASQFCTLSGDTEASNRAGQHDTGLVAQISA